MSFNPDQQKIAVELFNNTHVMKVAEHKHLGLRLDLNLSFSVLIKSAISKSRNGIGLPKYLSKNLVRHTPSEVYQLYVRPQIDYRDAIYHIPAKVRGFCGSVMLTSLMQKLESVQYSAVQAITGTWRGTSREKLYAELDRESLSDRRWSRRLTSFFKIINNLTSVYTEDPILPLQQSHYSFRNQDIIGRIKARTEKFKSSFYPHCLSECNDLDPEIRLVPIDVAVFKKKLLSIIRQ